MPSFRVSTPQRAYDAIVERGSLARAAEFIPPHAGVAFVVTTSDVWKLHGATLKTALAGRAHHVLFFPGGEPNKRMASVEALAEHFGLHKRALQRLFADYVGTSPKWVIQRYRLLEAVERVAAGEPIVWSDLAAELGYFDQAHLIRHFKTLLGTTPAEFARAQPNAVRSAP